MNISELSSALKIEADIPENAVRIYDSFDGSEKLYDESYIISFQEKYSLFSERNFAILRTAYKDLMGKEELLRWVILAVRYIEMCKTAEEMQLMPMPAEDGTAAGDFASLLAILPSIEIAIDRYESRGFSRQTAIELMSFFDSNINWREECEGRPFFPPRAFKWLSRWIFARVFICGSLLFELTEMLHSVAVLENRLTGEAEVVMTDRKFHRSGLVFGGPGLADEEGCFEADFIETENEFIGYRAIDGYASKERKVYSKSEWSMVLKKGNDAVYVHMPIGADISKEAVKRSISEAMRIIKARYPERNDSYFYTRTWLLSPNLAEHLNATSKILEFSNIFEKYPTPTDGRELMGYLFPANIENYEQLPEDTSLQRKIKKVYLDGGYIYGGGGIILRKE